MHRPPEIELHGRTITGNERDGLIALVSSTMAITKEAPLNFHQVCSLFSNFGLFGQSFVDSVLDFAGFS